MSDIEQIDFSTLIWVKNEIDETLNRAKLAIEEYLENPEDENQLQFCATYLHQVQGTLKMVELYGAAMVAEEMEQVAKQILDKEVDSEKDAFDVLMRGIILLPDYLERIQLGHKDIPMVLLPLVNDLRTIKGVQLLSESALFNPDLSLGLPQANLSNSFELNETQLNQVVKKIRSAYQVYLLNWLQDIDVKNNLKDMQVLVDKLKTVISSTEEKQLFWVAGGLFEALISGGLEKSVTVKQLAARLDQSIRKVTANNEDTEGSFKKLTNNLLYYVALADSKDRRINEIQTFFNLKDYISDDIEIENAQSSLSGKNRELLESVSGVIKEDLLTIQENLDLYNRSDEKDNSELETLASALSKISDTLGIIGIGVARSKISLLVDKIEENVKLDDQLSDDDIMEVAQTLLFVESSLDENIISLGDTRELNPDDGESLIPSSEMKKIVDSLASESINNLQKIKQNYVMYLESNWDVECIKSSPKLLMEISGALKMSGFVDVAKEVDRIEQFTTDYMHNTGFKPSISQFDLLAESVASLEYYLEYLSAGTKGDDSILKLAKTNLDSLFENVENVEIVDTVDESDSKPPESSEVTKNKPIIEELDANLDQMSDDDFELDLDDDLNESVDVLDAEEYDDLISNEDNFEDAMSAQNQEELIVRFSDETDDDIKEVFTEELEEELEHLNTIYFKWKKNPEGEIETLGEIRRIFHTLKGSGRLVGANAIGDFSWKIEEMTNLVLENNHEINSSYMLVLQNAVDILPELSNALKKQLVVPNGYFQIIDAANKVIANETVNEIIFDEALDIAEDENKSEVDSQDKDKDVVSEVDDLESNKEVESHEVELIEESDDSDLTLEEVDDDLLELDIEESNDDESLEFNQEGIEQDISDDYKLDSDTTNELNIDLELNENEETDNLEGVSLEEMEQDTTELVDSDNLDIDIDLDLDSEDDSNDLAVDPIFVEILQQEVEGHLNEIEDFIKAAKSTGNNKVTEKMIRITHTLNGAANMASVNSIVEMTAPLELFAKTSYELNLEFDEDSIKKISEFKNEATRVMMDLNKNSEPNVTAIELGVFFKDQIEKIESKKESLEVSADINADDFDLSQFIDSENDDSQLNLSTEDLLDIEVIDEDLDISDIDFDLEVVSEKEIVEDSEGKTEEETEEEALQGTEEEAEEETEEEAEQETEEETEEEAEQETEEETEEEAEQETEEETEEETKEETESISTSYDEIVEIENKNEFDDELLEIFKEEANDILDRTEHVLSELEENPKDLTLITALQRDLHTLKGGARMANLEKIGDLSHILESLLENLGDNSDKVDPNSLGLIHDSFDMLNKMKNQNDLGQDFDISEILNRVKSSIGLKDNVIPEESKLDQSYLQETIDPHIIDDSKESEEQETVQDDTSKSIKKKSNILSGNQIKVNSVLLDNLVNYAGEVSIYRSRLEQEIGSFRVNILELGNTVARIREQLRNLDVETEAQIISTFQSESEEDESFDPLEMDRFSQLQQLSRSLAESVSDLSSIHNYLDDVARTSDNLLSQQSRVNTELQEGLMETRLVSFNSIVPRLRRLIRTTSNELNKSVKLEVQGAEGEMDKTVLEGVIAPLEHILRNAIAHGIESNRTKLKKPKQGSIVINVRREATEVVLTIEDDGAGINRDKVRKIAIEKGLIKKDARISKENIDRLILHSGFTTVDKVSKLAGRGVGMDVVTNQINLLGGSLDINSKENEGTKFSIRLPYTLALSSALLVEISENIFAIPVSGLEGIIRMSYPDYLQRIKENSNIYEYANEEYKLHELNKLLGMESEVVVENNQIPLVMIRSGEDGVALRVDKILGSREIVVKTVGAQISSVPGIYGATILGDGNIVLILDVIPLSRSYSTKLRIQDKSIEVVEQEEVVRDPIIMIVDDSITMRKVGERILRRNDYDVTTAKDGLDALEQLEEVIPDVMLLDIEMPRMDGYELAIEMKKSDKYSNIPIIMITSRTGEKHRQKAMDLGVDRYLGKPYQEADLLENISDLIEKDKE